MGKKKEISVIVSPDFDSYAAGETPVAAVRCALCANAPCACPPFGSDAYFEMVNRRHGH